MPVTITLNDRQADLLVIAADNGGRIFIGEFMDPRQRKAADSLVRCGLLSTGSGLYGASARHLTDHGRRIFADLIRQQAAQVLLPHITGEHQRAERAEGAAGDLYRAGYLAGGDRRTDVVAGAAAILHCRHDWTTAQRMAQELADLCLLAGTAAKED